MLEKKQRRNPEAGNSQDSKNKALIVGVKGVKTDSVFPGVDYNKGMLRSYLMRFVHISQNDLC